MYAFVHKLNLAVILTWLALVPTAQAASIDVPYTTENAPLIIEAASSKFGADNAALLAVAKCESGLQNVPKHWDVNGYAWGVFQFHKSTFYNNAAEMGLQNPDITDPTQQTIVAAWMFSKGRQGQWSCYAKTRGNAP